MVIFMLALIAKSATRGLSHEKPWRKNGQVVREDMWEVSLSTIMYAPSKSLFDPGREHLVII